MKKISFDKIHSVLQEYIAECIAPKITSNKSRFFLGFASGYITQNTIVNLIGQYDPVLKMFNIIDKEGMIDIDLAKENALKAIKDCGGKVSIFNYIADIDDIDSLYRIASKYV